MSCSLAPCGGDWVAFKKRRKHARYAGGCGGGCLVVCTLSHLWLGRASSKLASEASSSLSGMASAPALRTFPALVCSPLIVQGALVPFRESGIFN